MRRSVEGVAAGLFGTGGGVYLGDNVGDGGGAHYDAVLVLEEYPRVDPGLG